MPRETEERDTPRPTLRQLQTQTVEQRLEQLEYDVRECKAVSYIACNYMHVIIDAMGLRDKVKKIDADYEDVKNGIF